MAFTALYPASRVSGEGIRVGRRPELELRAAPAAPAAQPQAPAWQPLVAE